VERLLRRKILKKISPPRNRREFSLTLKTTNMNDVDSYACNLHSLINMAGFSEKKFKKDILNTGVMQSKTLRGTGGFFL